MRLPRSSRDEAEMGERSLVGGSRSVWSMLGA